jgi:hypothetical protein
LHCLAPRPWGAVCPGGAPRGQGCVCRQPFEFGKIWGVFGAAPAAGHHVQEWLESVRQLLGMWMCRAVRAGALQHLCDCEPSVGVQGVTLVWE